MILPSTSLGGAGAIQKEKFINAASNKKSKAKRGITMGVKRANIIPNAPVARILMRAGASRVSAQAAKVFAEYLQDKAVEIGEQAVKIARHAGRKTVHEGDIRLAAKR